MTLWERFRSEASAQGAVSSLDVEVTKSCNLACTHCYKLRSGQHMDPAIFQLVLRRAREAGIFMMGFNGGEPLSHPDFLSFAKAALGDGMLLTIVSNGTLVTEALVHELSPWKGIRFQVSLYGHDPASFAEITGGSPDSWDRTIRGLSLLKEAGFHVEVILLALASEVPYLPRFMDSLRRLGIAPYLNPLLFPREDGDIAPLALAVTREEYASIAHLETLTHYTMCQEGCQACGAGVSTLGVTVSGDIVPCLLIKDQLGNIRDTSLEKAQHGERLKRFLEHNKVPARCRSCELYPLCVRCPGAAHFATGDLQGIPDEPCRMARLRSDAVGPGNAGKPTP